MLLNENAFFKGVWDRIAFGDQKPFLKKRFLDFQKTLGAGWKLVMINAF